ncbi:RNA methyltransferase [Phytophthora cinnamomi]|uniref:RNA methyltransferase n=1 Tax=Phytophthora cinnamomi TaxID=4785 RepID=UPI00355A84F0|nr:RNA methyltransferase [Phytophthora cinnamomi]
MAQLLRRWPPCRPERFSARAHRFFSATAASPAAPNGKRCVALTVEKLNGNGDGVGSYVSDEGVEMQVVVPFAAPGDEMQVDVWERDVQSRDKWAAQQPRDAWPVFGQQVEIVRSGDQRVQPQCSKYFGVCGGCKLQHVSYAQQLKEKQEWIQELFAARRHSPDMEIRQILGVEDGDGWAGLYHYRNKMEFTCSTGRWLLDEDKYVGDDGEGAAPPRYPFTVGMFPAASAYDFTSHEGFLKQIVLRRGVNGQGRTEIMLGLVTTTFNGEQSELLKSIVDDLVQEHQKDLVAEGNDAPRSHLEDTILGHRFEISFDSFFQPNSVQASALYREVQAMIAAMPEKPVVWDLFCGVGSIGICMGAHAKKVIGFELVEAAVERAKVNAHLNGYSSEDMQFFCVDLAKNWQEEELLEKVAAKSGGAASLPDMVIVDPPRAGLHKKLIKMLRRIAPRHICYVSCNPHSQVPDLAALCAKPKPEAGEFGSYRVRHLHPVDMLPHTPHIETIAWLERCD